MKQTQSQFETKSIQPFQHLETAERYCSKILQRQTSEKIAERLRNEIQQRKMAVGNCGSKQGGNCGGDCGARGVGKRQWGEMAVRDCHLR